MIGKFITGFFKRPIRVALTRGFARPGQFLLRQNRFQRYVLPFKFKTIQDFRKNDQNTVFVRPFVIKNGSIFLN